MAGAAFEFGERVGKVGKESELDNGDVTLPDGDSQIPPLELGYRTESGTMFWGKIESLLDSPRVEEYVGKVQLIFTSPPFPLNRKKRYGNKVGDEYIDWLANLAPRLRRLLTEDGSMVIEVGNAWEPGRPVMSTLALQALLEFMRRGELELCQQFVCHNPARLPTPAQWVNVKRIRVKDAYTNIWWMSPVDGPKANNRNVLIPYSESMRELLRKQDYNDGIRPSGHKIGKDSFKTDNGGAIPSNVLTYESSFEIDSGEEVPSNVLAYANTFSNDAYRDYCKEAGLPIHPARMPPKLAEFFINLVTDKGDLVLDPFAGSNTTGSVAEELERRWVSVEPNIDYIDGSQARFDATTPGRSLDR